MSDAPELTGPDLAQGVALADLAGLGGPEGAAMLQGHAHGEAVLLVRRGDEVFALAANCTHYGAPLVDGLVHGETLRCPWHHACFHLRTGEALAAPALTDLKRYAVVREGDRVRVGEPLPPLASRPSPVGPGQPEKVVIAGAGAAGNAAAEMLRRQGYGGRIVLVGREESVPYDRPNLSKDYLAGNAPEEWIPLRPREFYAAQEIELRLGVDIVALDTARRSLTLAGGEELEYGALLLALGADPVRLDLPGAERIHYLRSLADCRSLLGRLAAGRTVDPARRAVVVGASFIGLEVAASLRSRGLEVTVVGREQRPLARVLGPELGDLVRSVHAEKGVDFRLGETVAEVGPTEVTLGGGERLPADLVVAGIGVRPNVGLAERAGLAVDGGIRVDEFLETNAPGVYAAGDLALYPERVSPSNPRPLSHPQGGKGAPPHDSVPGSGELIRVEHWVHAERQGQAVARNLLGRRAPFSDPPFFWSQHFDLVVNYVGHASRWDRIEIEGSLAERSATVSYLRDGRVRAVATVGRDLESLRAEVAMLEQERA